MNHVKTVGLLAVILGSPRVRRTSGVGGAGDPRVAALVVALTALGTLASAPLQNGISRQIETRADVTALQVTGDADAFVAMQKKLAVRSLSDPTPPTLSQWWFGSHPTTTERVAVSRALD